MVTGQPDFKRFAAIDFVSQSVGMYIIRDWSAKEGFYKTFYVSISAGAGDFGVYDIYTVPSDHMFFLTDAIYVLRRVGGSIGDSVVYATIQVEGIGPLAIPHFSDEQVTIPMHFSRSIPVPGGKKLQTTYYNDSSVGVVFCLSLLGWEESDRIPEEYEATADEVIKRGMFNALSVHVDERGKVKLEAYNHLSDRTIALEGRLDRKGRVILPRGRRIRLKWFRGY